MNYCRRVTMDIHELRVMTYKILTLRLVWMPTFYRDLPPSEYPMETYELSALRFVISGQRMRSCQVMCLGGDSPFIYMSTH